VASTLGWFLWWDIYKKDEKNELQVYNIFGKYTGICCCLVFFILLCSTFALVKQLEAQVNTFSAGNNNHFKKEFRTILALVTVFSMSYLIRFVFNFWIFAHLYKKSDDKFAYLSWSNLTLILFEVLPIEMLLVFHYKNFRKKKTPK
jgi:hypothetical protein